MSKTQNVRAELRMEPSCFAPDKQVILKTLSAVKLKSLRNWHIKMLR